MFDSETNMKLLVLLNGHHKKILGANGLNPEEFEVVKLDEKLLAGPSAILKILNGKNYEAVYYGCIELILQRFHTFMKIYILLSGIMKGAIIDEQGNQNQYSLLKLILLELPMLAFEAAASIIVVFYQYLKMPVIKWLYTKKS